MVQLVKRKTLLQRALILGGLTIALCYLVSRPPRVYFNQHDLLRLEMLYGGDWLGSARSLLRSTVRAKLGKLAKSAPFVPTRVDDQVRMLDYVFAHLPRRAIVLPTEGFYYFKLTVDNHEVRGNFRVADIHLGKMHFTYYLADDQPGDRDAFFLQMSDLPSFRSKRLSAGEYEVSHGDGRVVFILPTVGQVAPTQLKLLPEEEFVGQVYDESGMRFFLLYNQPREAFYYVLNEEATVPDLLDVYSPRCLLGRRTGFAFYDDRSYDRRILVGVALNNIADNNCFDGPADQVPFACEIRQKLYRAYPNCLIWGEIDSHGVYVDKEKWTRLAISPYVRYVRASDLVDRIQSCGGAGGDLWTALTREWWNTEAYRISMISQFDEKDLSLYGNRR